MKQYGTGFFLSCIMLFSAVLFSAEPPKRLDFYDMSNNHIMYLVFVYNESNQLIGRTLYMADGTFKRDVALYNGTTGKRSVEVSKNFNTDGLFAGGDTMFVTKYQYDGATTSFTIRDEHKMDYVGGSIAYTNANPLDYQLTYQTDNSPAARMVYEVDGSNTPTKVNVYDDAGIQQYYGVFANVGVQSKIGRMGAVPQAAVRVRGRAGIDLRLNMTAPSMVTCELLTLSGRVAGVLFNENVSRGNFLKTIAAGSTLKTANGVYLIAVYVNGKLITSSRYLHQHARGGVR